MYLFDTTLQYNLLNTNWDYATNDKSVYLLHLSQHQLWFYPGQNDL